MRLKWGILIIILLIFGFGFWYYQSRSFSKEVLKLEILGPDFVRLGEEVEYLVKFKNNGDVSLESARLIFESPRYSLRGEGKSLREEINFETIYPGQEKTISFKIRLLGKEGEKKVAKAWLQYRPKNLESFFESATIKTTVINSVPLTLEFDIPSKVAPERKVSFRLNYFSNVDYPLTDLRILVDYPPGFEFLEARPFSLEKNEWEIGLLNKAEGGRIEITGKFSGEVGEEKMIKARLGMWQNEEFVLLKETVRGVEIVRPHLFLSQQINGNPQYIASPGDSLHYEIFFKNIGEESLSNLFLVAKLEGRAFDFHTLKAEGGKFKLGDNSIVFDSRNIPQLQFLESGEEGKVEFWIELKKEWRILGEKDKNPILKNTVLISQIKEEFVTKVNSKLTFSQKVSFEDEIFDNGGPLPPEGGKTTTFTIIWEAKNYYNDVSNVRVKASLPPEVKLTGKIIPEEAKITFDSESREIVWEIGEMSTGQGVVSLPAKVVFQVAFTPEELDQEKPIILISEAKISGDDEWTGEMLEAITPPLEVSFFKEREKE